MGWLGVDKVVWLPDPVPDAATDGRVGGVLRFVEPGHVLFDCAGRMPTRAHKRCSAAWSRESDARGRSFRVTPLYKPSRHAQMDNGAFCDSYLGFYLANSGLVMLAFGDDESDARARQTLRASDALCTDPTLRRPRGRHARGGSAIARGSIFARLQSAPLLPSSPGLRPTRPVRGPVQGEPSTPRGYVYYSSNAAGTRPMGHVEADAASGDIVQARFDATFAMNMAGMPNELDPIQRSWPDEGLRTSGTTWITVRRAMNPSTHSSTTTSGRTVTRALPVPATPRADCATPSRAHAGHRALCAGPGGLVRVEHAGHPVSRVRSASASTTAVRS
jgi:hypothetical protein